MTHVQVTMSESFTQGNNFLWSFQLLIVIQKISAMTTNNYGPLSELGVTIPKEFIIFFFLNKKDDGY